MGNNRKERRRLAAKSGANRRVKLDLFAEPSEDLGGSSAKDEAEKDVDAKLDAELPNLPSSSGNQVENPLSLLGQYSDDDLDEGSNDTTGKQVGSLLGADNQVKMSVGIPSEAGEVSGKEVGGKELSPHRVDDQKLLNESTVGSASFEDTDAVLSNKIISDEKCSEVELENQDSVCGASDTHQSTGVDSSCWKMVLHEESNRYYYWNTVTGETSWEVPDVLTLGTGLADEHKKLLETSVEGSPGGNINDLSTASGVKLGDVTAGMTGYNGVTDVSGGCEYHQSQAFQSAELSEGAGSLLLGSSTVCAFPYDASMIGSYSLSGHINASAGICQDVHGHGPMISAQDATDLPSYLLRHAESMLERLKLMHGSDPHQHGWISKHMVEIEVRLSDIRSLLPHGSSLGPFWLHSERQLSQLEDAINTGIGEQNNKTSGMHLSSAEGNEEKLVDGEKTKPNADVKASISERHADMHDVDVPAVVQKTSLDSAPESQTLELQQNSELNHSTNLDDKEVNGAISEEKTSPKTENQPGEDDVDMDVDMEVEDAGPEKIGIGVQLATDQLLGPESEFIPPPPDEEWIPPPPPDEPPELCPPPPPPCESEPVQSTYNGEYSVAAYGGSNVPYFGNSSVVDASGNGLYQLADGSQVAAFNPAAVYYTSASTVQPTSLPNPTAESVVYYGLQNEVMPFVPVEPAVSSGLQANSGQMSYSDLSPQHIISSDAVAEEDPLFNQKKIDSSTVDTNAGGVAVNEVSSTYYVVSAPPTVSVKEYVSAPFSVAAATSTTSAPSSDVPASLPKEHTKATKVKKSKVSVSAALSLRSNKKVSSLVDKWKAAKEELEEEEEEQRETPLEILEKKRQREIEEWRAQQIASGEAKDNANFQPLGGNWRERVKRRRAEKGDRVETSSADVATATMDTSNTKQPHVNVNELSTDLPCGWQAYWDESSKKVYYANSTTSETTWTRPTR